MMNGWGEVGLCKDHMKAIKGVQQRAWQRKCRRLLGMRSSKTKAIEREYIQ
jgi:hypothetical protein